ncbi:MAG: flagellar biosynthesis protein FlhB [Anaerovoracaceae bacterium]
MADSQDKTEQATPKRRKDARKKGQVFSSRDVVNLVSMVVMFSLIRLLMPSIFERMVILFEHFQEMAAGVSELSQTTLREVLVYSIISMAVIVLPLVLAAALSGTLATAVQTRFLFSYESMKPKLERISPLKGIKRMFSLRSLVELLKNMIKISVIAVVIYRYLSSRVVIFARMTDMGIEAAAEYFLKNLYTMCLQICLFFAIVAGADYLYQRWDYEKNLKMSKQEVKEEYKQLEGDPQVKGRIRELQRKMATTRMMQQVPDADVIIRNPTHYAVALRYDAERDVAPRVVAKGMDELAARIVKTGEEHGVFIKEDPPLTRAIYAAVEIGDVIPESYYNAIADILALVYRMKGAAL